MGYWENRADERMKNYHLGSNKLVSQLIGAYEYALRDIKNEIDSVMDKYNLVPGITPVQAKTILSKPIGDKEYLKLQKTYKRTKDKAKKKAILMKLNAPAYKARIDRLEALGLEIYYRYKDLAVDEIVDSNGHYKDVIKNGYYHSIYDIQKGIGAGVSFNMLPDKAVDSILLNPWSGKHFSSRIWKNTDVLARNVTDIVTNGLITGKSNEKMTSELMEMTNMGQHACNRVIRTETTYMANQGELESYKELGIDKIQFLATLDVRTSDECRSMDNKIIDTKDIVVGKNYPPLHPHCRSTTVMAPESEEELKDSLRRAKDETGKTYTVPSDFNYDDWHKNYVEDKDKKYLDVTRRWNEIYYNSTKEGSVDDLLEFKANGKVYKVDNKYIKLDYTEKEKAIAQIIARKYKRNIKMFPRVEYPLGIQTPDYLINNIRYDLKAPIGNGEHTIYDAIKGKKKQSNDFIVSLDDTPITLEKALKQINEIYNSKHTKFVDGVLLYKEQKIIKAFKRK